MIPVPRLPAFVISLDFELYWGVRDIYSVEQYGKNILGGRQAIPQILSLFKENGIAATWATVGFVTFSNKRELLGYLPDVLPEYVDQNLDPYRHIHSIGINENEDPYHYGYSLVREIEQTPGMELASHSFSHFYCLEPRHNQDAYKSDLLSSVAALQRIGSTPRSMVFCRNQYDEKHLDDLAQCGFSAYRGNETSDLYAPRAGVDTSISQRIGRLVDSRINLTGANNHVISRDQSGLVNVPASRFLRPAGHFFEGLRLRRITEAMTYAAQSGSVFHLWWHPHNFGGDVQRNVEFLKSVVNHFRSLQDKYGMLSLTMSDVANSLAPN